MDKKELTIIQINDTHGYIEEHWEHFYQGRNSVHYRAGGYARILSYVNQVRHEKGKDILFLDNGDTFHGTYPVVQSQGGILPPLLNTFNLDAMTGHWDFAYGPAKIQELVAKLNYPMLAINAYKEENDELLFPPYLITEKNGLKIGVIGIAAFIIDKVMPKKFSEGVYFTMGKEELPGYITELKEENVDLIVVLSHLGFPQEVKLVEEVDGIDVLLSGHTHNRMTEPALINDTIIFQSGCHGSFLGQLDLTIEDKKIVDYQHQLVLLDHTIEKNANLKQLVDETLSPYRQKLADIVGYTEVDLNRSDVLESTMDNLLLASLLDYAGADIAFSNGWRYGAPIPKGPITENDLWNIIPTNPPVSKTMLTGAEIWEMLEENIEHTFSRNPYQQMGGYLKRSMGLSLYFKFENPYGQRIQEIFIGNEKIDLEKEYEAVFVTVQGIPEKYGHNRRDTAEKAIDVLRNYIQKRDAVSTPLTGHIKGI